MRRTAYEHIERELFSIQEDYISEMKDKLNEIEDEILKELKNSIEKAQKELDLLNLGNLRKILEETINEYVTELENQIEYIREYLDLVETRIENIKSYIHSSSF